MKRAIFVLILVAIGFWGIGQSLEKAEGDSLPWELRKQVFIYNSAKSFNDLQVAKMALYNLLSENPSNVALYDTLALIYLEYNQFASAALVAKQALQISPNDIFATEVAAAAFDNLGVKDKAVSYYETLYLSNNDVNTLYKIAFLQLELERYNEAVTSADIVIANPESEHSTILFPTEDGQGQEVPLNVATHRIKAMVEESKGNLDEAKQLYLQTLKMHPGFQIVQRQLQEAGKEK